MSYISDFLKELEKLQKKKGYSPSSHFSTGYTEPETYRPSSISSSSSASSSGTDDFMSKFFEELDKLEQKEKKTDDILLDKNDALKKRGSERWNDIISKESTHLADDSKTKSSEDATVSNNKDKPFYGYKKVNGKMVELTSPASAGEIFYLDKEGKFPQRGSDYRKVYTEILEANGGEEPQSKESGKLDFFDMGAFSNGYQFGDVTKAILGTAADAGLGAVRGMSNFAEGFTDLSAYLYAAAIKKYGDKIPDRWRSFTKEQLPDMIHDVLGGTDKEEWALQWAKLLDVASDPELAPLMVSEVVSENQTDALTGWATSRLDRYSLLGRTSNSVTEGVGQLAPVIAIGGLSNVIGLGAGAATGITSGAMFATGTGSGISEAYQGGATDAEAASYGVISGAADALTELIFGGLGKSIKAVGIGKGLSSADDMLAKTVSSKFKNQIAKNLAEFGIKAGAEGTEEVLAGIAQAVGKKLTYKSEEDIWQILEDENLLEQFVVAAVTSGIAQSGVVPGMQDGSLIEANKQGKDFITGLSKNEQAVVDKEYEARIAEKEADGNKLTGKEKSNIYDKVISDMEKGYISTDTIEEVLGGETYKTYKDTVDKEDSVLKEFEELYKGEELERQKADFLSKSERNNLLERLGTEVSELVKGDRLIESYNERTRKRVAFEADLTKYDEKQRTVIQKAIDSGILNNTNRTHEFVDMIAKISADKGVLFDFTNNEKLKGSGFAVDGKFVNGYVTDDGVTVNIQSSKALNSIVGHEITHVLEGTELYAELQNALFEYAKNRKATNSEKFDSEYKERLYNTRELYKTVKGYEGVTGFENIKKEVTADLVGDYLFTDGDFINNLSTNHRNVFQKIYDEIKYLAKIATAGSKEARELEKVKKAFEDAYKANASMQKNTATDSGAKYSIGKTSKIPYGSQLQQLEHGKMTSSDSLYIGIPSSGLQSAGFSGNPFAMNQGDYRKSRRESAKNAHYSSHSVPYEFFANLPEYMADAPMLIDNGDKVSVITSYGMKDTKGYDSYVIGGVLRDQTMESDTVNLVKSAYPLDDFVSRITKAAESGKLVVTNKNKAEQMLATIGIQPAEVSRILNLAKGNISQHTENVNKKFSLRDPEADKNYLDAVKRGDTEAAQTMVGIAAKESGYNIEGYHGTDSQFWTFSLENRGRNGERLGVGYYFTADKNKAELYSPKTGRTKHVYLDIKKPISHELMTISEKEWGQFLDFAEQNKDKYIDGMWKGNSINKEFELRDMLYFDNDADFIKTFIDTTAGRNATVAEGYMRMLKDSIGYDGLLYENGDAKVYVAFTPEQIKSADPVTYDDSGKVIPLSERFNAEKKDIRFSLSESVEESNDLIAVHNLQSSELPKALALGGMPMPSIAVLKAQQSHEAYGDVSLIFPKDAIDPKKNRANKVYGGDAWTPVYPSIEYKVNAKAQKAIEAKIDGLVPRDVQRSLGHLALDYDNMSSDINRYSGEMYRAYQHNYAMQYAFLVDKGLAEQLPMTEKDLDGSGRFKNDLIFDVVEKLGAADVERLANENIFGNDVLIANLMDMANENAKKKFAGDGKLLEMLRNRPLYTDKNFGFAQADSIIRAAYRYVQNGLEQTVDYKEAKDVIEKAVDKDAYKKWLDNLFADIVEKEGIRNNADYYTPSGNRRSWEALHWENTLENVLKVMKAQDQTGQGFFGGASIFGVATKDYGSIDDIKADSDRLRTIPEGEYDAMKSDFSNRLAEIADSIKDPNERNKFIALDRAVEEIVDAVRAYKTKSGMLRYMQKWNKRVTEATVDDIVSLVNDVANMPTGYFEAKPQRAVGFDEVAVFVIPRNADVKLKQELLNRGYSIAEYDPDVEGDRQKVVNQFEEFKFSLSNIGETPKSYGNYNVYGKDVSLAPAAAPETVPKAKPAPETAKTAQNVPEQENIAPVAVAENTASAEELFPDDLAPIDQEIDSITQQMITLENRLTKMAENEQFGEEFNSLAEEWSVLKSKLDALEQESVNDDAARISSLDDAVAPIERTAPEQVDVADIIPLTKKVAADIARNVRNSLGLSNNQMAEVHNLIQKYSATEFPSRDQLFYEIKDRFGTYTETTEDEVLRDVKAELRGYKINVDDVIKGEIADYRDVMRRNFGKVRFSKKGLPVDVAYADLAGRYPNYFPENIISPTDQLERIIEVANMDVTTKTDMDIDDESLMEVVDALANGVSAYKQEQRLKQANRFAKESFDSLMQDADANVPPVNIDRILASRRKPVGTAEDIAPVAEIYDTQHKNGVVEGQQAMFDDPVSEKVTRKVLHERIIDRMKDQFHVKGFELDDVLRNAKNLSTFSTVDNIPQRVMEKALGYKQGQVLSDLTVNKVAQNETEGIKWLNSFTDRKSGLLAQISRQYNIKPGSKQSAAAQMYAEGFYVNDKNEIIQYGDAELAKDFPDLKVQENIKGLAKDDRIRQIYDETLTKINESRTRNAYPEIPRLDNYFLHFRAMDDTFSRLGLPFNPNDIRAKDLPTDLNGVTADLKPGQPYFASAMHRTGKRTSFDLLGGLEKYLNSAKNQIYHIDDIQNLRALRNYIAETYGQAHGLESLDLLTEEEAQERIEQVYGSHLSTFAKFLNEEANVLAGKTALIDRGLEGIIGRRGMTFLNTINQQVGKNMVGFNVSSSATNFLPVFQSLAKTNKAAFVKGFAQTVANKVGSIYGKGDSFADDSPVIIRRKGADSFYRTPWQKLSDPGYVLMSAVDDISTELIARAKYNEFTSKGMDSQQAHYETDKWVSRLMGDRSLGQQPQLYNSKMLGLITKFQLEVRNQLDSQFYDTIQEAKVSNEHIENRLLRNAKTAAKVTSTFVQLAVLQHAFGKAFESVAGYNPAFDIIDVLIKTFGWDDDEEGEDTILDNIEEGFFALMEDLPYTSILSGGRIPIASALPVQELFTGKDQYGNEKSRWQTLGEAAPYYFLPGGYGQVKKTVQGLSMFSDDHPVAGSYTDSGNLRFPVDDTLANRVQAGLFGQWANKNAKAYFDGEYAPLKEKQIQEYIDVDMPIQDYWDYRSGLSGLKELSEQADYINSLDLPTWKKNLLLNNLTTRKEKIDLTGYGNFADFEEFDFAQKDPDKYEFLKENGVSVKDYTGFDEDTKRVYTWAFSNPEKYDFLQQNGVTLEEYRDFDDDSKDAYTWAFNNPEGYTMSKAITSDVVEYRRYTSDLYDIRADKDRNGKSISGTAKAKKIDYINSLDIDYGSKLILFKSQYKSDDTYNNEIIEYLNGRNDISFEETVTILTELGFKVYPDGTVTWD